MGNDARERNIGGEITPQIKFSEEWDKLKPDNFQIGTTFTTFRAYTPQKQKYYESNKGEIFDVILNGKIIGRAELTEIHYMWSGEMTPSDIEIDTYEGWDFADWQNLMKKFYDLYDVFGMLLTFEIKEVSNAI